MKWVMSKRVARSRRNLRSAEVERLEGRWLLSAQLVADLDTTPASSRPGAFFTAGETTYFTATDSVHGIELWATDGTAAGTRLVKDIAPNESGNYIYSYADLNGTLFFGAADSVHGRELWKSDGTESGTVLIKDVQGGYGSGVGTGALAAANGRVFFVGNDGTSGNELWCSDGSEQGTHLVKDILAGSGGGVMSDPLVAVGNRVYFIANDGTHGNEVWSSDGTAAGTSMVKDIKAGSASSDPGQLAAIGDRLFFNATDGTGTHLWVSDGSEAGTHIAAGGGDQGYVDLNGVAYYYAYLGLARSDGTAGGGSVVFDAKTIPLATNISSPVRAGNLLYFWVRTSSGNNLLYRSDGTTQGTVLVEQNQFQGATNLFKTSGAGAGDDLFFTLEFSGTGAQLWHTDGTSAGTKLIGTMNTQSIGGSVKRIITNGSATYFAGTDAGTGEELWKTDGTAGGTALLKDINTETGDANPDFPAPLPDGRIIFPAGDGAHQGVPFVSGGTPDTTSHLLNPGIVGSSASNFTRWGDWVYFIGNGPTSGWGIWRTQGTAGTTQYLATVSPGYAPGYFYYSKFVQAGGYLYFLSNLSASSILWRTDGTPSGTIQLWSGRELGYGEAFMSALGSRVFFAAGAANGENQELWTSDGTVAGTVQLKDINPGTAGSTPQRFTTVGNTLYFTANDGVHGVELWRSDGTAENTMMVADINPGTTSAAPYELYGLNGIVYFGVSQPGGGEFWRSDGTPQGTYRLASIGALSFQAIGNKLLFLGFDAEHGGEPWVTDGTPEGTKLLKDINPGPELSASGNYHFQFFGGAVVFLADDGVHGSELWESDGTSDGTVPFAEIYPGPSGSRPVVLGEIGGWFYVQADDGVVGRELWRIADDIAPALAGYEWRPGKTLRLKFTEDVSASLAPGDIVVRNQQTAAAVSPISISYDAASNTATCLFAATLPEGDYVVEMAGSGIADAVGNILAAPAVAPHFSVLPGDANRDGAVNFADLVIVAQHYGGAEAAWADGDFDGDGVVGFADLVAVAQRYSTGAGASAEAAAMAVGSKVSSKGAASRSLIARPTAVRPPTPQMFSKKPVTGPVLRSLLR